MLSALLLATAIAAAPSPLTPLELPDGASGIGFDDLVYSAALDRVLVPAGRSGRLDLVDPSSLKVEAIEGFTRSATFTGGHGQGTTSADAGGGYLFAADRDSRRLTVLDATTRKVVATAELGGNPDYVRWVEPSREIWVTEPRQQVIEYFRLEAKGGLRLVRGGTLAVEDGPESLVVSPSRRQAFTHTWHDATVVLDVEKHRQVSLWKNGCEGARGIALDDARGLLFVGCEEGKAVALDVAHGGRRVGEAATGKGVDIVGYDAQLRHLYVPGAENATLTVLSVGAEGALAPLQTVPTAPESHCVAVAPPGRAFVCDPQHGRLLFFTDPTAPARREPSVPAR